MKYNYVFIDYKNRTIDVIGGMWTREDPYWIPFRRFRTKEHLLDWTQQIGTKVWGHPGILIELEAAFNKINHK